MLSLVLCVKHSPSMCISPQNLDLGALPFVSPRSPRLRGLDRAPVPSASSAATAGQARDDDVEEGDDAGDDCLKD